MIVVRLSRETEATTSPERQTDECVSLCETRGYEVVGVAQDLDVSGSADPFSRKDRPQLARWLARDYLDSAVPGVENTDPCPFDLVVFYRLDRLVRSVKNLNRLILWAEQHDLRLVSATEPHFDLTQPFGQVIASLVGTVAELELEAIRERTGSTFKHNAKLGKWRGGNPPWGYLPDKSSGEWRLVQDPVQVQTIREVVQRVLAGERLRAIAADLTRRNVQTTTNRYREVKGQPQSLNNWHPQRMRESLESPTMLGQMTVREPVLDRYGKPKRDSRGRKVFGPETVLRQSDGTPLVRADPILSVAEQERIKAELRSREVGAKGVDKRKNPPTLLLGCVYCAACGQPAYRMVGGKGRKDRYRCKSVQLYESCSPNTSTPMDDLDDVVTTMLLGTVGDAERLERVWEQGSDITEERAEVDALLVDLTNQLGTGPYKAGTPQRAQLDKRIADLTKRQESLNATPTTPSGWKWGPTGEKFADWWHRQDNEGKNAYLRRMGVTVGFIYPMEKRPRERPKVYVEFGEVNAMLAEVKGTTPTGDRFEMMAEYGVAGVEYTPDLGPGTRVHLENGTVVTVLEGGALMSTGYLADGRKVTMTMTKDGVVTLDDGTVLSVQDTQETPSPSK